MTLLKNILISSAVLTSLSCFGWGQKGHDVVAYIAECHLTPEAKAAAEELLDGKSIVYYANWMDNASNTPEYAYTKTWHYKNIDADETYEKAKKNDKGDVVNAIQKQTLILNDTTRNKEERALALKMLVHFLGDVHQPMHLGHAKDLGGNRVDVQFFRNPKNLHGVWDTNLVEAAHKWSYTEWQQQIDRATPEEVTVITASNDPDVWAKETFELAKNIYEVTSPGSNIEYKYIAKWTPVIENQLLKGGLRLANLLNTIFAEQVNN